MYIQRAIEDTVHRVSDTFRVLLLTGPRQVGKTTLLRRLAEEGQSLSDAARQVAKETGYRKGELYRLAAGK